MGQVLPLLSAINGGYKGIVIFTIETDQEERTYFYRIKDLKK